MTRRNVVFWGPLAILGLLLFILLGGVIVEWLWNWLLPPLFGLPAVTFWQALGLLALARILFGGFGHGYGHRQARRSRVRRRVEERFADRMAERMDAMTPEERDRLRQRLRERLGVDWFGDAPGGSRDAGREG
ncbi:MAG: hypothetical protein R2752_17720 [Vicinamibacterales bacterium]